MRLVRRPILVLLACGALGLAACGGGDDDDDTADDGSTDGTEDDGATDGGDTVDPAGTDNTYVISDIQVPDQAGEFQLDLDGSGPKNKLGGLLSLLSMQGLDLQGAITEQINQGGVVLLANLKATDLTDATGVGLYVYLGDPESANPAPCVDENDIECGLHLGGDASFEIAADSPTDAVVVGENAGGSFSGGPGEVTIELSLAALADPISISLVGARIEVEVAADGLTAGILGGAITKTAVDGQLIPAVADVLNSILTEDGCSADVENCCPADTTGEDIITFIDPGEDCVYTGEELAANSLVSTTIGTPDLDLDPSDGEDVKDALSLGVGFSAVGGTFDPP